MDFNTFLFEPTFPKIGYIRVVKDQVVSMHVPSIIPVSMDHKYLKHCIKPVFISRFRKECKSGKAPKVNAPFTWKKIIYKNI